MPRNSEATPRPFHRERKDPMPPAITRSRGKIIPPKITGGSCISKFKKHRELYAATTADNRRRKTRTGLATLLGSTSGLRDSFILREIVWRPRPRVTLYRRQCCNSVRWGEPTSLARSTIAGASEQQPVQIRNALSSLLNSYFTTSTFPTPAWRNCNALDSNLRFPPR